jgi:glycosyltransferase involved in cell wall biosynthesis
MKVLWTCNVLMPEAAAALGAPPLAAGSWMPALAEAMKTYCPDIEIGFVTMDTAAASQKLAIHGVSHYVVHCAGHARQRPPSDSIRREFSKVLSDFSPDIIHINGSEFAYGWILSETAAKIPTVLSIQGLIGPYEQVFWGDLSLQTLIGRRTLRDWITADGLIEQRWRWKRRAWMEAEILRRMKHVIGRTFWDLAYSRILSPQAVYHEGQELLRSEFFDASWELENASPHTIFSISAIYPLKGSHVLLDAAALLKSDYPDIQVRIPGIDLNVEGPWYKRMRMGGYYNYLIHRIRTLGLENNVTALGPIDARRMAKELSDARVFVSPSFIENSSNAICEAMLVGTPCVASYVGGTPSIVSDGVDALCFPAGEAVLLAERIRTLFEDDALCRKLSENARRRAIERHDPRKGAERIAAIYRSILENNAAKLSATAPT